MKRVVTLAILGACAHAPPPQAPTPTDQLQLVSSHEPISDLGGRLSGTIHTAGSVEPFVGATVIVDGQPNGSAITDVHGEFDLANVAPGRRTVTVYYADYTRTFDPIEIGAGERSVVDLTIHIVPWDGSTVFICEGCSESMIDTTSTQQGFTIRGDDLRRMPHAMSRQDPLGPANARVPALVQDPR